MIDVVIYTTPSCPYCDRAKKLLNQKGIPFTEIDVSDPEERQRLVGKSGGCMTVPQIFINDQHIGGCDDLYALEKAGKLDPLLGL